MFCRVWYHTIPTNLLFDQQNLKLISSLLSRTRTHTLTQTLAQSDKGLYGWLYRVYPEPWQVVLQTPKSVQRGGQTVMTVDNVVALISETRPTYQEAVQAMVQASATAASS